MEEQAFLDKFGVTVLWRSLKSYISKIMPKKISDLPNDKGYITKISRLTIVGDQSTVFDGTTDVVVDISHLENPTPVITSYNGLENKPSINGTLLQGNKTLSDLGINIPTRVSQLVNDSDYASQTSVTNKVNRSELADVAFSGSYTNLKNKPVIPTIPSNVSAFINDAGYLTEHQDVSSKVSTAELNSRLSNIYTKAEVDDIVDGIITGGEGEVDLTNYYKKTEADNRFQPIGNYLTSHQDVSGKANTSDLKTVAFTGAYSDLTGKPSVPSALSDLTTDSTHLLVTQTEKDTWNNMSSFDGTWESLQGKPVIPDASNFVQKTGNVAEQVTGQKYFTQKIKSIGILHNNGGNDNTLWNTNGGTKTLNDILRVFTIQNNRLVLNGSDIYFSKLTETPMLYHSVILDESNVYQLDFAGSNYANLVFRCINADLSTSDTAITENTITIMKVTSSTYGYTIVKETNTKSISGGNAGEYLTITSASDNNKIYFRCDESSHAKTIEVSTDGGGTWTQVTAEPGEKNYVSGILEGVTYDSDAYIAELQTDEKVLIKGDNSCYQYNFFASTGSFEVSGNIMSLCNSDPSIFNSYSSMAEKNTFDGLFKNCTYLYYAKNLILPSIVLSEGCYSSMFRNCSNLINAPKLPATTLAKSCYAYMFKNCSALIESSELPATTMADYCYHYMFSQSGLETAPKLPATTLARACYRYMFEGTPLTSTPDLPAKYMQDSCYMGMFSGCEQLINVPKSLPGNAPDCFREMFMGCILLETAPELPSDVANENCYNSMFKGCRKLTTAPELPAIYLRSYSIVGGCYASMFEDCDILTEVPELPATEITKACYMNMFKGCYNLVNGPSILPAVDLNESYSNGGGEAYSCYAGMFKNCTRLEKAPVLPATTLVQSCYEEMFYGCLALDYIECLATDISANDCTYNWVNSVNMTQSGTFVKGNTNVWDVWDIDDEEDVNYGNSNGIPTGWDTEISQSARYLTFDILTNGNIDWNCYNNNKTIQYSTDDGVTWSSLTPNSTITVETGDKILFKGELYGNSFDDEDTYCAFGTSDGATFNVSGNIMSLRFGDNFQGQVDISTQFSYKYMFAQLFEECGVKDASNLCLPATTLSEGCYMGMFLGSSITKAPKLPATKLADYCYMDMFKNCSSLTVVPSELPAKSLETRCYASMFNGTAITTAPSLPATKLTDGCYIWMFSNCTQLTASPDLNATTLVRECYKEMFKNCSSLEDITCTAYFVSALDCTTNWVQGVAASGTFNTVESTNWPDGNNGIPSGWSRSNTDASAHAKVNSQPFYDDETGITTYPKVRYDQGSSNYYKKFLTFEILSEGIINWKSDDDSSTKTIFCSKDKGEYWEIITSSANGTPIEVQEGDILIFKGSNASYEYNHFETNVRFNVYGNISSLIYGDDEGETGEIKNYYTTTSVFKELFLNCARLESANDLILYPLILTESCYAYMFKGCLSLQKAPQLLATTLAESCYQGMFEDCINLEAMSALPASTLQEDCYNRMFYGCAKLSSIKCLATTFATNATLNWVQGVAGNGVFIKNSSTTWSTGTSGIPTGWTVV